MILAGLVIAGIALAWLAFAAWLAHRQKITLAQALLLAPLALSRRVDASVLRRHDNSGPLIYVVSHRSPLEPALMLSLLPDDTLHILDDYSARAGWLEPWRSLARTIAFNPEHVFVSRRLVTVLRRGGRLCVYMPADVEPGSRGFRLYRAVARIALRAQARVMPVHVSPAASQDGKPGGPLAKLVVHALEPATIEELVSRFPPEPGAVSGTSSGALYGRMEETRGAGRLPEASKAA